MMTSTAQMLKVQTTEAPEFIDLTDDVISFVREQGVTEGVVVVFTKHTTASIRINENESLLMQDMAEFLEELASCDEDYRHNDFSIRTENMTENECPNGHAHCQALGLGTSEMVPIIGGELQLGRWQRVFLIELDHPQQREVIVQVLGGGI